MIPIILMKSFFFVSKKSLMPSKNGFHNSIALGLLSSGNIKPVGLVGYGVGLGMNGRPLLESIFGWLSGFSSIWSFRKSGFGLIMGWLIRQFRWGGFVEHGSIWDPCWEVGFDKIGFSSLALSNNKLCNQ